jgi:hypothetical protein
MRIHKSAAAASAGNSSLNLPPPSANLAKRPFSCPHFSAQKHGGEDTEQLCNAQLIS